MRGFQFHDRSLEGRSERSRVGGYSQRVLAAEGISRPTERGDLAAFALGHLSETLITTRNVRRVGAWTLWLRGNLQRRARRSLHRAPARSAARTKDSRRRSVPR